MRCTFHDEGAGSEFGEIFGDFATGRAATDDEDELR